MSVVLLQQQLDELFDRPENEGLSLALIVRHRDEIVAERYGTQPENIFQPAIEIDADCPSMRPEPRRLAESRPFSACPRPSRSARVT